MSGSFTNTREVFKRFDLDPGRYVIVVCTFKPKEEGDYLLRIFSEKMSTPRKEGMVGKSDNEIKDDQVRGLFKRLAGADGEIDCDELQDLMTFSLKKGVFVDLYMCVYICTCMYECVMCHLRTYVRSCVCVHIKFH